MTKKKLIGCLAIFITLFSKALFATEYQIIIKGNDKSENEFVSKLASKCVKAQRIDPEGELDVDALKTCIINSKLFSEVNIEKREETITVSVKERLTLIPIPIVSIGSGEDASYGLFLMETNFLGMGKTLVLGGVVSGTNDTMFLMYEDPAVLNSNWMFGTHIGSQTNEVYRYNGDKKGDGIQEKANAYGASIGYTFNSELSASMSLMHSANEYKILDDYQLPEDFEFNSIGLNLSWSDTHFKFYYQDGLSLQLDITQQIDRSDDEALMQTYQLTGDWQMNLFSDHALQVGFELANTYHADRKTALKVGGSPGMRGINDSGVWAKAYGSLAIDYNIPLSTHDSGTWTVAPFFDAGKIQSITNSDETINYTAYGIGTYYYFKEIAIPAIGIYMGMNNKYQKVFSSFTLGFKFN